MVSGGVLKVILVERHSHLGTQYSVNSMTNFANILFHAAPKLSKITFFF